VQSVVTSSTSATSIEASRLRVGFETLREILALPVFT
jgi:hypothetical protein